MAAAAASTATAAAPTLSPTESTSDEYGIRGKCNKFSNDEQFEIIFWEWNNYNSNNNWGGKIDSQARMSFTSSQNILVN